MRRLALSLSTLLVLALSACRTPPPPRDQIRFEHGPHLLAGVSCVRCHAGADPSTDASHETPEERPLLPSEESCRTCHDDEDDGCPTCHTEPARAATYPRPRGDIRFDHAQHEDAEVGRCVRCHGGADPAIARTFQPRRPPMSTCTNSCHADDMRAMRCDGCHQDLSSYSVDEIILIDHGLGFLDRHAIPARTDSALCTQCHEPTFCEDCHLSAQGAPLEAWAPAQAHRDFVHRGDFLARHGTESGFERGTCARCHGVSYCDGCHQASQVGGSVAPGSPHPPGWLDPLSPTGHARAARRDLLSCASCHESDAERLCTTCHGVGGAAGNPHPPGFGGGMDPLRHGVCRACHVR